MMNRPLRYAIFALVVAFVALLASCPLPITDRLVAAVEDGIDPYIIVESPVDGSTYHSEVVFQGRIIEDAISSGDGRGQVSAISFFASNQSAYKGGITVATDGSVTVDPSKGDVPITFDMATGAFSFTFDARSFGQTIMEVFITAVDLNGNEHEVSTTLYESDGPIIDLQSPHPTTTSYTAGSAFDLLAIIGDSIAKPTTVEEIDRISFSCPDLYVTNATINVPPDLVIPESVYVTNLGMNLIFDPSDRSLRSEFPISIPSTMDDTINIIIDVEDLNGHVQSVHKELYSADGGPLVVINNPTAGSYYSSSTLADDIDVNALVTLPTGSTSSIAQITVNLSSPDDSSDLITAYTGSEPSFNPGTSIFNYVFNAGTRGHGGGPLNLIVIARDDDSPQKQGESSRTLLEDSDPPTVDVTSFTSAFGADAYSRANEIVTLVFDLSDTGAGLDADMIGSGNLLVSLAGAPADTLIEGPSGTWTATGTTIAGTYPGNAVPFSITVEDRIGNQQIWTETSSGSDPSITHYYGTPGLTSVTVTNDTDASTTRANANDVLGVSVVESSGRDIDVGSTTMTLEAAGGGSLPVTLDASGDDNLSPLTASASLEGRLTYTLHLVDRAGNVLDAGPTATPLYIDFTDPVITSGPTYSVTINNGSNVYTNIAMPTDVVTLTFDVTDNIDTPLGVLATPTVEFVDDLGNPLPSSPTSVTKVGDTVTAIYNVNASSPQGRVRFTYAVSDLAGNGIASVSPVGNITIDSTGPVITEGSFSADGDGRTSWGIDGEDIVLTFTMNDVVDGDLEAAGDEPDVSFIHAGGTITSTPGGTPNFVTWNGSAWEARYAVSNFDDGRIGYQIIASDRRGLPATGDTAVAQASSSLIVDTTKPVITPVSLVANSGDPAWIKGSESATLRFDVSDAGLGQVTATPGVTMTDETGNTENPVASDGSPTSDWLATFNVGTFDDGGVGYTLTATDDAGNPADAVNLAPAASPLTVDNVNPIVEIVSFETSPAVGKAGPDSTMTLTFRIDNDTGGGGDYVSDAALIDSLDPSVSMGDIGSNYNEVQIQADEIVLGSSVNDWIATYDVDQGELGSGNVGYRVRARDRAGNEANWYTIVNAGGSAITVEYDDPTITFDDLVSNGPDTHLAGKDDTLTLTFEVNDDGSEVKNSVATKPTARVRSGTTTSSVEAVWSIGNDNWEVTFTGPTGLSSGTVRYEITAKDLVGNERTIGFNSSSLVMDAEDPDFLEHGFSDSGGDGVANSGDTITLKFDVDDDPGGPEISSKINGKPMVTIVSTLFGNSVLPDGSVTYGSGEWTAVFTVPGIPLFPSSSYSYRVDMEDQAGNTSFSTGGNIPAAP